MQIWWARHYLHLFMGVCVFFLKHGEWLVLDSRAWWWNTILQCWEWIFTVLMKLHTCKSDGYDFTWDDGASCSLTLATYVYPLLLAPLLALFPGEFHIHLSQLGLCWEMSLYLLKDPRMKHNSAILKWILTVLIKLHTNAKLMGSPSGIHVMQVHM